MGRWVRRDISACFAPACRLPDRPPSAVPGPLCFAVAPHWAWTALGVVLMQASVVNTPAISVYLTLGVPRDRIAMVMTTVLSAYSLGLIASNLLTGLLAQVMSLRALFWVATGFFAL